MVQPNHRHGICVPLFSLHTKKSCRIGDFQALFPLIDWCKEVGFNLIQLLPINETGDDGNPYYALSAFALDPIYIHVPELATQELLSRFEIRERKSELLKKKFNKEQGDLFLKENSWAEGFPEFEVFLQAVAFQQMEEVKRYATERGVLLMGDLPISLSPQSWDVQAHQELFDCRYSAGAPPDYYQRGGQIWGSPIMNWDEMRRQNFSWWRERLRVAERLFHLFRIDHVVGLFRIWAVAPGESALEGRFLPENPALWQKQGEEILKMMLESTRMIPIAEDLGVIPPFVTETLRKLKISGTKVMRWEQEAPRDYEPLSLTTVSTPDSETLEQWWKGTHHSELSREKRCEILRLSHQSGSLYHVNLLQEYLALFPDLVSPNPDEERINIPGTVLSSNWSYRFRPSVEELLAHRDLAKEITTLIQ